jgi:hypothetical protein
MIPAIAMTEDSFEFIRKDLDRVHERNTNTEVRLSKVETELSDVRVGLARLHGDVQNTNKALGDLNSKMSEIRSDTAALVALDKGYRAWKTPLIIVGSVFFMMASSLAGVIWYFVQKYGPGAGF